jgi:hypothetical protein
MRGKELRRAHFGRLAQAERRRMVEMVDRAQSG